MFGPQFEDNERKSSECCDCKAKIALVHPNAESLRQETEGKLQLLVSPRKNGLDSLLKGSNGNRFVSNGNRFV